MNKIYPLDFAVYTGSFKIEYGAIVCCVLNGLADIELVETSERKSVNVDSLRKSNILEAFMKGKS